MTSFIEFPNKEPIKNDTFSWGGFQENMREIRGFPSKIQLKIMRAKNTPLIYQNKYLVSVTY